jgi:hypothetical protein
VPGLRVSPADEVLRSFEMSSAKLAGAQPDESAEAKIFDAAAEATRFSMNKAEVQIALAKIARLLDEAQIPYALIGALAMAEHGYVRLTIDIDLLLAPEGLAEFKRRHLGRGYVEKFPGSRGFRDTENGVPIDVVLAGDYPGDGKPKPVRFPDPATAAIRGRLSLLPLARLVELKIASGMSAAHRLKDLADVLELVRSAHLEEALADDLDESVREKYRELWRAAQTRDPE